MRSIPFPEPADLMDEQADEIRPGSAQRFAAVGVVAIAVLRVAGLERSR